MDNESKTWTVESASAWLQGLLVEEPEKPVDQSLRQSLLGVCSVLTQFRLDGLRTTRGLLSSEEVSAALRDDLLALPRIPGEPQKHTLKPRSRAEGLSQLGTIGEMLAKRSLNKAEDQGALQQVFDDFLKQEYSAGEADDLQRLEAALQVTIWLGPYLPDNAPIAPAIEKRLAIRRLLYPMERLTRGFMGRTGELTELRAFVGVLDPQSRVEAVTRFLRAFTATRSPFMLYGIGGVGKSTLLAEFIRQHLNSPVPFPWVYLDFDNPRLNVAVLSTLIDEAVEQLRAQYAGSDWRELLAEAHQQSLVAGAASYQSEDENRSLAFSDVVLSDQLRDSNASDIARLFAVHLRRALESSGLERMMGVSEVLPFLIVLDTFEEVQKRGIEMARIFWGFLRALQQEFPRVRIVVSGRAPVPELSQYLTEPKSLALKEFDGPSAVSFLLNRGVPNQESAEAVYKQVGGNPLNLKLAAQVARQDNIGKGGIERLRTSSYWVFAAAEHVIQGQLYQRVLQRIPDEDLQKLAHPGLVVRRITENVIRKVLAEPCGLGKIDKRRAEELFAGLEKQVDLVIPEPDGALRHQQDIRRVMLKMLESEKPQQVRDIHDRAFKFYKNEPGTAAQIERLYHALQLRKSEKDIRSLWVAEATESLLSSVDELPPSSQLLVYVLTRHEPPQELHSLASLDQWERLVESRARRALQYGDYSLVDRLLNERQDRTPGSALYAISALCSMKLRNYKVATEQINKGIESAQSVNRIDRLVELWRLRGELLEEQGSYADADSSLAESQKLAVRMGSAILGLQIYAERARICDDNDRDIPPVAELDGILKETGDADFASARTQLRGLFRICGGRSPLLLLKGLRVFTLQVVPGLPDPWWDEADKMDESNRLNEFLQTLLEREPENLEIREVIADSLEEALNPTRSKRKK